MSKQKHMPLNVLRQAIVRAPEGSAKQTRLKKELQERLEAARALAGLFDLEGP